MLVMAPERRREPVGDRDVEGRDDGDRDENPARRRANESGSAT